MLLLASRSPLPGDAPADYVLRLAAAKAAAVREREGGSLPVLGADTSVVIDGTVLGKPADRAEALAMLRRLSGRVEASGINPDECVALGAALAGVLRHRPDHPAMLARRKQLTRRALAASRGVELDEPSEEEVEADAETKRVEIRDIARSRARSVRRASSAENSTSSNSEQA